MTASQEVARTGDDRLGVVGPRRPSLDLKWRMGRMTQATIGLNGATQAAT